MSHLIMKRPLFRKPVTYIEIAHEVVVGRCMLVLKNLMTNFYTSVIHQFLKIEAGNFNLSFREITDKCKS